MVLWMSCLAMDMPNFASNSAVWFCMLYWYMSEQPILRVFFTMPCSSSFSMAGLTYFWLTLLFSAMSFLL